MPDNAKGLVEVRSGRRPFFGRELWWEIPIAVGMAIIGEGVGAGLALDRGTTNGVIAGRGPPRPPDPRPFRALIPARQPGSPAICSSAPRSSSQSARLAWQIWALGRKPSAPSSAPAGTTTNPSSACAKGSAEPHSVQKHFT
ncbi:hypothetical protein SAMN05878426_101200 [Phaeovulum vinaykumarii]|uniref:Uncharacterized protein n=1 Tax=Phaeovulum vinaykumarii TaxID=407234 RepID=A0A1N7JNV2_9RHOB|nr:hypothetical protein SAMN05421795_101200 [Phaeovulum vinaykumarii]SOB90526.1 hypothetical protein SAMN05878426_101200 [Phaeovulum vinaykumarii]